MFGENTRELGWFVKAGMTLPSKPSATATTNAAELLGKPTELGAVAPGYFADPRRRRRRPARKTST